MAAQPDAMNKRRHWAVLLSLSAIGLSVAAIVDLTRAFKPPPRRAAVTKTDPNWPCAPGYHTLLDGARPTLTCAPNKVRGRP